MHVDDDCAVVTYTLGHEPAPATLASTFTPALTPAFATVSFDAPTVTVGRHDRWRGRDVSEKADGEGSADGKDRKGGDDDEDAEVIVTIAPPSSGLARLFGGYITLTPDDDGPTLRVPYLGYNGDYQAIGSNATNVFPFYAQTNASTTNRTDVFASAFRSIVAVAPQAVAKSYRASSAPALEPKEEELKERLQARVKRVLRWRQMGN